MIPLDSLTIGELYWMLPFPENKKKVSWFQKCFTFKIYLVHITKIPFHVFDRYEIHIQALANVFMEHLSSSDPHLHKIDILK